MRLHFPATLAVALFVAIGIQAQNEVEEASLFDRHSKRLLDPGSGFQFAESAEYLAGSPKGMAVVIKAIGQYRKTSPDRYEACVDAMVRSTLVFEQHQAEAAKLHSQLLPDYIAILKTPKAPNRNAVLAVLQRMGAVARPALPALRELRESDDDQVALRAMRVMEAIEKAK